MAEFGRRVALLGESPRGHVPSLYARPYRGVPQFDLSSLDAMQSFDGPRPFTGGRLYAPPEQRSDLPAVPVRRCPYGAAAGDGAAPLPLAPPIAGAAVDGPDDGREPLRRAVRPRASPS